MGICEYVGLFRDRLWGGLGKNGVGGFERQTFEMQLQQKGQELVQLRSVSILAYLRTNGGIGLFLCGHRQII